MNIEVIRINAGVIQNPAEYVKKTNREYFFQLRQIAGKIAGNKDKQPVVLLSGPSGSGKTTTAMILAEMLGETGCLTHVLSMDNYFKSLSDEERNLSSLGLLDLESPSRIDNELLNSQIEAIERCEEINVPKYNFSVSKRDGVKFRFRRKEGELVIFEGIHALNPDVIKVDDSSLCKIYVSVRTRITCGNIILHPSKIRLMRRMIRDCNFRKRSLRETMNMFHSVEAGENKYIMPYKYRSDYDIDTFMAYELNVYRDTLLEQLRGMSDVPELADITEVMENLVPMEKSAVSPDSLICEFTGGGVFRY
ncbi:MAG: adenylyl-sulfate kinase [Ruminococcus sp.]|nr:adenylyl-sulfate kinase [Ruminococcus sp.]